MSRVIQTQLIPATDTRPERIRASFLDSSERSQTIPFPAAASGKTAHRLAVKELLDRVAGWPELAAIRESELAEAHEVLGGYVFII